MLRHHELFGDELHGAKISIEPPTRNPAYEGEAVFDGETLWIATGITADSWKRSTPPPTSTANLPPPAFSWTFDLSNSSDDILSLFYSSYDAQFPRFFSWQLLRTYRRGVDLPRTGNENNMLLSLNSWIEQRGTGLYLPAISAFGGLSARLEILTAEPSNAATAFNVSRFTQPGTNRVHENTQALWVKTCQATVVTQIFG